MELFRAKKKCFYFLFCSVFFLCRIWEMYKKASCHVPLRKWNWTKTIICFLCILWLSSINVLPTFYMKAFCVDFDSQILFCCEETGWLLFSNIGFFVYIKHCKTAGFSRCPPKRLKKEFSLELLFQIGSLQPIKLYFFSLKHKFRPTPFESSTFQMRPRPAGVLQRSVCQAIHKENQLRPPLVPLFPVWSTTSGYRKGRWSAPGRWVTPRRACRNQPRPNRPRPTMRTRPKPCDHQPPPRRAGRSASGSSERMVRLHRGQNERHFLMLRHTEAMEEQKQRYKKMDFWMEFCYRRGGKTQEQSEGDLKCELWNSGRRTKVTKATIWMVWLGHRCCYCT